MNVKNPFGFNLKLRPLWYQIQLIKTSLLNPTIQLAYGSSFSRADNLFKEFFKNFCISYGVKDNFYPSPQDIAGLSDLETFKIRVSQLRYTLGSRDISLNLIDLLRSFMKSKNYDLAMDNLFRFSDLTQKLKDVSVQQFWADMYHANTMTLCNFLQKDLYNNTTDSVMSELNKCANKYTDPVIDTLIAYLNTKSQYSFKDLYLSSSTWQEFWDYAPLKVRLKVFNKLPKSHLIETAAILGVTPLDLKRVGVALSIEAIRVAAQSSDQNQRLFWLQNVSGVPVIPILQYRLQKNQNLTAMSKLEQQIILAFIQSIRKWTQQMKSLAQADLVPTNHPVIKEFRRQVSSKSPAQVSEIDLFAFQREGKLYYVYQIVDARLTSTRNKTDIIGYMVYDLIADRPIWWKIALLNDAGLSYISSPAQTLGIITGAIQTGLQRYVRT
ncbi:hypothetical protein [Ewingella americana]|uniref:Uncharacterized protein n=1 Tax=Ewingella americana TaxID=41202 RepID=A0A502GD46_9GAMM|nr:hypothetical protein [Ewingella americana]TPG60019.1 hypothetical protein EAH77_15745 [Ewingella americana]